MDKFKTAAIAVEAINKYTKGQIKDYELIKIICNHFDKLKNEELTQSDLKFLKFISNLVGIPHYYDLLEDIQKKKLEIHDFTANTMASNLTEATLHLDEETKVHRYQKQILDLFSKTERNRYFLSASTSFGKTHLVYDIINKMNYSNIVLIFPTIALLSENLQRLYTELKHQNLKEKFAIHTLSDVSEEELQKFNIFIYTPERFLSYMDRHNNSINFDFIFIDEIYKLDNEFIIDGKSKENERDVAYRLATFQALHCSKDILLAGPYIEVSSKLSEDYNESFDLFLEHNSIKKLDYNNYEIVDKTHTIVDNIQNSISINDELLINIEKPKDKNKKFIEVVDAVIKNNENSIVFCSGPRWAEDYAKKIIDSDVLSQHPTSCYDDFLSHIKNNFDENWVIYKALMSGIGVHHGLVPKYIQKETINLFNKGKLKVLLSTTTITEGVNTTAKNLIVLHSSKGTKELKPFDAKNISGRAGRFLKHYTGRVIILDEKFEAIINKEGDGIKHKNYDKNSIKDDVDLFYTDDKYLNEEDKNKKEKIEIMQQERKLPEVLFQQFKAVSRNDKIEVYDEIKKMTIADRTNIKRLISAINSPELSIHYDGMQSVINILKPIAKKRGRMHNLFTHENKEGYSNFIPLLYAYFKNGFSGLVKYKVKTKNDKIDKAMRDTADFVYNTLKYHAVKYLGVFNLMYKYVIAKENIDEMEDVIGIDRLLSKLEYNAYTPLGKKISDYGVSANILKYYESYNPEAKRYTDNIVFDNYEKNIITEIKTMFES